MRGTPGNNQVDVLRALIALGIGHGVSSATNDFVYQPGGTAHDNVYIDWAKLITAVNKVAGMRRILVDATFASPTVPSGTWAVDNVMFYGEVTGGAAPTLTFADGSVLTSSALYLDNIGFSSVSTTPVMTFAGGAGVAVTLIDSAITASAAAPFFHVATDAGGINILTLGSSALGDAVNPTLQVDGAATAFLDINDVSFLFANATAGTGTVELLFTPGSVGATGDLTDATIQFPQPVATLLPNNVTATVAYPQNMQWLANLAMPAGLVDAVTVVAVHGVQTANANTGIPPQSFLGDTTVPMPNHTSGKVTLEVVATIPASEQTVAWHAEASFKNQGGIAVGTLKNIGGNALSFFGPSGGDEAAFAGATIGINITANGIEPQVTGVAPLVIDWEVKTTYYYTVGA